MLPRGRLFHRLQKSGRENYKIANPRGLEALVRDDSKMPLLESESTFDNRDRRKRQRHNGDLFRPRRNLYLQSRRRSECIQLRREPLERVFDGNPFLYHARRSGEIQLKKQAGSLRGERYEKENFIRRILFKR